VRKLLLRLVLLSVVSSVDAITVAAPERMAADQATEANLAAATNLSWQGMSFTVQPPKGFDLSVEQGPGGGANFFWHGKKRDDGSTPLFMVLPVVRPNDNPDITPVSFIETWFVSGKEKAESMDKTAPEEIQVNGRPFKFVTYRRVDGGRQFNGFIAATESSAGIFAVSGQDIAGQKATLDNCWASFKTFSSNTK
jgi:hypothetical protein